VIFSSGISFYSQLWYYSDYRSTSAPPGQGTKVIQPLRLSP
jgi:hypothetical protein